MDKIIIQIDAREPLVMLTTIKMAGMQAHVPIEVEQELLEVGDYVIKGTGIGFERKRPDDFINSMVSKKLLNQISELASTFSKPILIIDGDYTDLFDFRIAGKIPANWIKSTVAKCQMMTSGVLFCHNAEEMATMIVWIASKSDAEAGFEYSPMRPRASISDKQIFFLTGLPGCGRETARMMLEKYGNCEEVIGAIISGKVRDLPGIGEKKWAKMRDVLVQERGDGDMGRKIKVRTR